eukprot:1640051-Rhodomonas_salina.1
MPVVVAHEQGVAITLFGVAFQRQIDPPHLNRRYSLPLRPLEQHRRIHDDRPQQNLVGEEERRRRGEEEKRRGGGRRGEREGGGEEEERSWLH